MDLFEDNPNLSLREVFPNGTDEDFSALHGGRPIAGVPCSGLDLLERVLLVENRLRNQTMESADYIPPETIDAVYMLENLMLEDEVQLALLETERVQIGDSFHEFAMIVLSNKRLLFVNCNTKIISDLKRVGLSEKDKAKKNNQTHFDILNQRVADVWFFPIPLENLFGISVNFKTNSQQAAALNRDARNLGEPFFLIGLISILGSLRLYVVENFSLSNPLIIIWGSIGIICLIIALFIKALKYQVVHFLSDHTRTKTVTLGIRNPLTSQPQVINISVKHDFPLKHTLSFLAAIQNAGPRLGSGFSFAWQRAHPDLYREPGVEEVVDYTRAESDLEYIDKVLARAKEAENRKASHAAAAAAKKKSTPAKAGLGGIGGELAGALKRKKQRNAANAVAELPPGWGSHKDELGRTYFFNLVTRESQWDPPRAIGSNLGALSPRAVPKA